MTDKDTEPNTLDTEEDGGSEQDAKGASDALEQSSHINATREEAAWEAQTGGDDDGDEADDRYPDRKPADDGDAEPVAKNKVQKSVSSVEELILEEVPRLSADASANLRAELAGSMLIDLSSSGRSRQAANGSYFVGWSGQDVEVKKVPKAEVKSQKTDCTLRIGSEDFFDIAKGKLNPQVAMLSEKIHVEGKLSLAIYFFNLFSEAHRD